MEIVNGDYGEEHLQRLILSSDRGRCKRWRDDDHSAAGPSASTNQSSKIRCVDFQPKIPLSAKSIVYELHQDANSVFYPNVFFRQLWILLKQNVIKLSRDRVSLLKNYYVLYFSECIIFGFILIGTFLHSPLGTLFDRATCRCDVLSDRPRCHIRHGQRQSSLLHFGFSCFQRFQYHLHHM